MWLLKPSSWAHGLTVLNFFCAGAQYFDDLLYADFDSAQSSCIIKSISSKNVFCLSTCQRFRSTAQLFCVVIKIIGFCTERVPMVIGMLNTSSSYVNGNQVFITLSWTHEKVSSTRFNSNKEGEKVNRHWLPTEIISSGSNPVLLRKSIRPSKNHGAKKSTSLRRCLRFTNHDFG